MVLPVVVGASFFTLLTPYESIGGMFWGLAALLYTLPLWYPTVCVPSLLYSLTMEFLVWRITGVSLSAVLVSSLLGIACGLVIGGLGQPTLFGTAGLSAGFITGGVLYLMKRASVTATDTDPAQGKPGSSAAPRP